MAFSRCVATVKVCRMANTMDQSKVVTAVSGSELLALETKYSVRSCPGCSLEVAQLNDCCLPSRERLWALPRLDCWHHDADVHENKVTLGQGSE